MYGCLQSAQRTSCIKPRGSPWLSLLRSDGSWDDKAGEADPVELKLTDYYSSETVVEAARQEVSGPNKRTTFMICLLKRESWKAALFLTDKGQTAAHWRKRTTDKKERIAHSKLWVLMQKGGMKLMTVMMSENQSCRSQVHVTAF